MYTYHSQPDVGFHDLILFILKTERIVSAVHISLLYIKSQYETFLVRKCIDNKT